ncbi:Glycosyl transferase group 1 [uncultured Desulfovibrio sp.]|uniref:Glycosyl transferase group 1 n=1 Tax=uncultured Desulfovibrio sp. TaxID=167968 RepID=A0A212JW60_9BACT|nr:glycosyltransferase family 4 protein [Desulfovibrio desulfuricans]MCB6542750.1 glycosyltransferase family 4 protein [Desulfovibrio desulfuricans]MCB6553712.1 glycosyltransferase family 4 protein [Desulfovibrio desulfuricans]MCB6565796.1 glycosyltransferase family 4 protein [Desulfovibrio desulfuricans]MCB7346689.1 glycosyltransferase family 4 protein [Desulfovibrio desulfuricans]MCQ4861722.1 glycosyltransferase family 4 protein [Desulfovibrio desulfuricans]
MKIIVLGNQTKAMSNFWSVLIRHMRKAGHEVVCCAPPGDADAEAALAAQGARLRHYSLDRKGLNPLSDLRTTRELFSLFRDEKPDLLFASTIKPVIYGCMAARAAGVPHVYATITGLGYAFEADNFFKKCVNRLGRLLYRVALSGAEGIFFQNQDDIKVFRQSGILGRNARVLTARGTGVDTKRFAPCPLPGYSADGRLSGSPVFLLVARLLEAKGLPEYAEAARLLKARYPDARFQVLGPPEKGLGSVSMEQMDAWQNQGCIEYLGETRDVRPYVAAAHVLVLPSWREGTPTSIMEGMSMGRPAVVTDAPGCREVVRDGVNGYLVPVRNPRALAGAMESFITSPESIARMGQAGRELALSEFDAEKVAARILEDMRVPAIEDTL